MTNPEHPPPRSQLPKTHKADHTQTPQPKTKKEKDIHRLQNTSCRKIPNPNPVLIMIIIINKTPLQTFSSCSFVPSAVKLLSKISYLTGRILPVISTLLSPHLCLLLPHFFLVLPYFCPTFHPRKTPKNSRFQPMSYLPGVHAPLIYRHFTPHFTPLTGSFYRLFTQFQYPRPLPSQPLRKLIPLHLLPQPVTLFYRLYHEVFVLLIPAV
ncbi:hypothetical protein STSP2_01833 [Anaerohalosphaera lusitana]|uniref:Uncharacterized protein n=1 Tax=Anaerohalosphaera lusitana TaxID=1936003 RepID=A0A1U9NLQ2_9BACT|nr:hypothetical protein STSP2_01833 [Anaerohalosphaera lusitana]